MPWIQYYIDTGFAPVTLSDKADDSILASQNMAQIFCPDDMGDPCQYDADITQNPPVPKLRGN